MIAGLPYDAEVEYLESTGTQYIDTGTVADVNCVQSIDAAFMESYSSSRAALVGAGNGGSAPSNRICAQYGEWTWWNGPFWYRSYVSVVAGEFHQCTFGKNGFYIDGDIKDAHLSFSDVTGTSFLFGYNDQQTQSPAGLVSARVRNYRFYASTNILVRDLIPVRVGNVGYMYDRVTRKLFGNMGSGSFILGPDVATPVMGLRRYAENSILPPGARWVEYLESTGTQWIGLPFGFDKADEVRFRFSIDTEYENDKYMVSPDPWITDNIIQNRFAMGIHSGGVYTAAYGNISTAGTFLLPTTKNDGNLHEWKYANYEFSINELNLILDVSGIGFGSTTGNLKLFYGYNSTTKGKIAAYDHVKNGIARIKLRPIAIGTTGYMLDLVSGEYLPYGNKGTGDFVIGPDTNAPTI